MYVLPLTGVLAIISHLITLYISPAPAINYQSYEVSRRIKTLCQPLRCKLLSLSLVLSSFSLSLSGCPGTGRVAAPRFLETPRSQSRSAADAASVQSIASRPRPSGPDNPHLIGCPRSQASPPIG